jgi:hypothetical protein
MDIFQTHSESEMHLASGANLSRSEHHSFSSSCFLSPYSCAHRRGTNVREARHRRTRESVCHGHGLAVGTWATVCRLSFLRRCRLSNLFLPKLRYFFFPILLTVVGCSLSSPSVFRNMFTGSSPICLPMQRS